MKNINTCLNIYNLMENYKHPWFIAGGWAIDLHLNKVTRAHADIEIGIFREDQNELKKYLFDWQLFKILNNENHKKEKWNNEWLSLPIHELYAEKYEHILEILLNEKIGMKWAYRRNTKIALGIDDVIKISEDKIPYLAPEIVLLYKSKHDREKDNEDLNNVIGKMKYESLIWLLNALTITEGTHKWINIIKKAAEQASGADASTRSSLAR